MRRYGPYILLIFILLSCGKDVDTFIPLNNIQKLNALFDDLGNEAEVIYYKDNKSAVTMEFDQARLRILPSSFVYQDGSVCTDEIKISLKTIDLASQIFYEQLNTEIDNQLFESNEIYYLSFESNGVVVSLADDSELKMYISKDESEVLSNTIYYTPTRREKNWTDITNTNALVSGHYSIQEVEGVNWTDFGYEISITSEGWYALIESPEKTELQKELTFCINKTGDYNFTNALVYLIPQVGKGCKVIPYNTFTNQFCDTWVVGNDNDSYRVLLLSVEDDVYFIYDSDIKIDSEVTKEAVGEYIDKETLLGLLSDL